MVVVWVDPDKDYKPEVPKGFLGKVSSGVKSVGSFFLTAGKSLLANTLAPTRAGAPDKEMSKRDITATPKDIAKTQKEVVARSILGDNPSKAQQTAYGFGAMSTQFNPYTIGISTAGSVQNASTKTQKIAAITEGAINTALVGGGKIAKEALAAKKEATVLQKIFNYKNLKTDVGIGAAYGILEPLKEGEIDLREIAKRVPESVLMSAALGTSLRIAGAAAGASSQKIMSILNKREAELTPDEVGILKNHFEKVSKEKVQTLDAPTTSQKGSAWEKITFAIKNSGKVTAEQEAYRKQWASQNAKKLEKIYNRVKTGEISAEQADEMASTALKSKMKRVDFVLSEKPSKEVRASLLDDIAKFDGFTVFEKKNATEAVKGIFAGKLPTKYEKELLARIAPEDFMNALSSKGLIEEQIAEIAGNIAGSFRSFMTGPDISASGRQTFALGFKDPIAWYKGLRAGLRGMKSEAENNKLLSEMMADPDFQLMRKGGISAPSLSGKSGLREEAISGTLPEKIPGLGKIYRASNRNYETTVFSARFFAFKNMKAAAERAGIDLEKNARELSGICEVINNLTGKGGKWLQKKGYTGTLSTGFFAPKLMASRINVFNPVYYLSLSPFARREALKSFMSLTIGTMTAMGLAKYYFEKKTGKGSVSLDLTSADFGKLKLGNTRIDLTGGYTQYIRTMYQIASGKKTSTITGKTKKVNEGYKGITRYSMVTDFLTNKAAPIPSAVIAALKGEDAVGKKVSALSIAQSFLPLIYQDISDILTEDEDLRGLMYVPLALMGVGVQTYGGADNKPNTSASSIKAKEQGNAVPEQLSNFMAPTENSVPTPKFDITKPNGYSGKTYTAEERAAKRKTGRKATAPPSLEEIRQTTRSIQQSK